MRVFTRLLTIVLLLVSGAAAAEAQAPPQQQEQLKGFKPLSEVPQQEQIPSARLVITAYAFVVVALFAYLLSLSTRLGGVKRELERIESTTHRPTRS
jgi:CcmD family protein